MAVLDVVVMAAGKGTRMKSRLPKVLHRLAGRPMVQHVLDTVAPLGARRVVVVTGHGAALVESALTEAVGAPDAAPFELRFARQEPQLGTGHAVQQAAPQLSAEGTVLVLNGDVPLIAAATLRAMQAAAATGALALLTIALDDPTGYGRIVRDGDAVRGIVEHKDATEAQRAIRETYTGVMAVPADRLAGWLSRLSDTNAQGEYYLTDIVAMAVADGVPVVGVPTTDAVEVAGVNSPVQLAALERAFQRRNADALMEAGTRLADPARIDVRGTLSCDADVEIDVGCVFEGTVHLGEGVRIGAHCVVADARIAAGAVVHPFTHIAGDRAGVQVGERAIVGPFARLRPGARLGREVHIGNFVEVKNSTMADGAKANHLAYLGDAVVGARVNYGAGSITANYDGAHKHTTTIGDDVNVGSNCVLVAPVTLGARTTVAGGSTITKDTPPGTLAVARGRQVCISSWKRPSKQAG
ncbi:bifunctional UDP-N-acetylglucosamine diphosphorylase/glucosamine-1-phosphate N-acetyltransferase GlmU [Xylophilus ampelinus]|uniref:Bifunctional protein GlmU n=1 Tax=Xylophilus ampelinus TaxID=54067 RepID=A0A318SM30_9BURK|nr:bifunctional UDP-N-acetylglucosamine diphosphorylase/glucosamine-1-phosphate N-acetyltransferase GlmU [Xylophilus ampelinus]MCS4510463.1 bifunctional UDP-N-acetylglucosamine diphosphorylase/glucosamine-1-phosphate N-acetyltransferase GlmU [Xylophilus ampelinus]PYE77919.1 UDP-N-acetylglucosamine pyrophosphorylase /glucosamine-1-phosphate N-acetyltransferase [Xylophilus ampelinus]